MNLIATLSVNRLWLTLPGSDQFLYGSEGNPHLRRNHVFKYVGYTTHDTLEKRAKGDKSKKKTNNKPKDTSDNKSTNDGKTKDPAVEINPDIGGKAKDPAVEVKPDLGGKTKDPAAGDPQTSLQLSPLAVQEGSKKDGKETETQAPSLTSPNNFVRCFSILEG